jgi:hypothetical protein
MINRAAIGSASFSRPGRLTMASTGDSSAIWPTITDTTTSANSHRTTRASRNLVHGSSRCERPSKRPNTVLFQNR